MIVQWPDEAFRSQPPIPGPPPRVRIPAIETFRLECGVDVYLVARDTLPTISMSLSIPTGSVADPMGKRGLVGLCLDLVEQGTTRLDKPAWAAAKADLASSVSTFANAESLGFGMASLHRNFEATAALMFEMIRTPGMRERDLSRLRSQRKANLAQNRAAPGTLARRLWPSLIHGSDHPHGRVTTEAQYDAIEVADCCAFWARMGPRGASLFVAGATDEAEIRRVIEPGLAAWGEPTCDDEPIAAPPIPASTSRAGAIAFAHVPGAAQSQILVGHEGPPRQAADYAATRLMAAVLGGGFSSRINMNIREDKGYAYGARAGFSYRRHGGTFSASSSVHTEATAHALREIAGEIRRIREAPIEDHELEREREGTLLGLPAAFATAQRIRATYAELVFFGLPLDELDRFQARLGAVTISDVHAAARTHLRETDLQVLVVGDGASIRPELEHLAREGFLGNDAFVELDADGRPS